MRILSTILLGLLAALSVTAAVFMAVDGNLARLTGWYHYRPGEYLFSEENTSHMDEVSWMRIKGLHDAIVCERDAKGVWWIVQPFRDRMSQEAVQSILDFTTNTKIVDTLPVGDAENMREYGVETSPVTITLKRPDGPKDYDTVARYTFGRVSPWLADAEDGTNLLPTTYLRTNFYGRDKRIHVVTGNILGLFKNGLVNMRDPHPLRFDPDSLRGLTITGKDGSKLSMSRASAEVDWVISSPALTSANQTEADSLVSSLARMKAVSVKDVKDVPLPAQPDYTITLETAGADKPVELKIYSATEHHGDGDMHICHATVNDRSVVFNLRESPVVNRHGAYSSIIQNVYQLPVLDRQALAQVLEEPVYIQDLPLTMEKLRSMSFANVDLAQVGAISLRRKKMDPRFDGDRTALRIELVPGNEEGGIEDTWLVSADGPVMEAEAEVVKQFVTSLKNVPATQVLEDVPAGGDIREAMKRYGLNDPTYILMIAPRPCAYHALLYGHDLPLVRSHEPRVFFVNRYKDPATGEGMWVGMESGSTSIYRLSTKLTRLFSPDISRWRQRTLLHFPISALQRLTLDFQRAPLVLDYNYAFEKWSGTLGGKDITPHINSNRAEHFVRRLQRMKVRQWLPAHDPDAMQALRQPVFRVKLDLELTDYSDVTRTVVEADEVSGTIDPKEIENWLNSDDETGKTMQQLASDERKTHKVTRTIEIAPMDVVSDKPSFYGRIKETGDVFILNFNDAQGLGSSPLDM